MRDADSDGVEGGELGPAGLTRDRLNEVYCFCKTGTGRISYPRKEGSGCGFTSKNCTVAREARR